SYHGQPDPAAGLEAVGAGALELATRARPIRVDRARIPAPLDAERGAAIAVATDLDVAVLADDELGVARHHGVAAGDGHGVIGLAAARAAVLAIELRLPALATGPARIDPRVDGVPAARDTARLVAPDAVAAATARTEEKAGR